MPKITSLSNNSTQTGGSQRRFIYFTVLNQITLFSGTKNYLSYVDGLRFSSKQSVKRKIVPEHIRNTIGSINYDDLFGDKTIAYSKEEVESSVDPIQYIQQRFDTLKWLFRATWLLKDNSMHIETSYLLEYRNGKFFTVHSNFHGELYFWADGRLKDTTLNSDEMKRLLQIESFLLSTSGTEQTSQTTVTSYVKERSRHHICLNHITSARQNNDLAMRVTFYCSAFESLFSTDNTELAHQVSERCAVFVTDIPEDRLHIYRNIKRAYSIRSKLIHGDRFKDSDVKNIPDIALFCDWALRMSFNRLLSSQAVFELFLEKDNAPLIGFMNKLLLGSERLERMYDELPTFLT